MAPTEVPTPLDADSTQEPAIYPDPSIGDEDEDDLPSLAEDPASSLPFGSATMRSSRSSSRVVFKTPPIKGARKPIPTKILWSSLSSVGPSTISPLCGGLFKEDSGTITAFVGSDPDSKVNLFSWDSSLDDWVCLGLYQPKGPNNKGPVHQGQFRPTNLKLAAAVERACTSHSGAKYHGLSALEGETLIPVRTFKAKKEKEQGNSGSGVSSSAPQDDSWKTVLPSGANPDSCTKKVGKRVWKWCSKCNRFMFHHANGHAAWLERRKQRQTASGSQSISGSQSSGSSPPQPSANLAGDCRLVPTPGSSFWFS